MKITALVFLIIGCAIAIPILVNQHNKNVKNMSMGRSV